MNKKAGFSDLFIFMIFSFVILIISAVFIYIGSIATTQLHTTMDGMTFGNVNASVTIDKTVGKVNQAYQSLYWISIFLMVGMILSIFIGSYLVTTKPVFFIPYIFIVIIAVIVSVGISNAYETIIADPSLSSVFAGFVGANFIMSKLPLWISSIGLLGGLIMFSRMGSRDNQLYGGDYYG